MGPSFNRLFTSHRRQLESGRMLQFNLLILLLFLTVACVSKTRVFSFLASFSSKSKSPLGYVARPHLSKRKFLVNNIHKLKKKKKKNLTGLIRKLILLRTSRKFGKYIWENMSNKSDKNRG